MRECYEPVFYEVRAIAYLAKIMCASVITKFRLPFLNLPLHERPEVDGYLEIDGKEWAIEVKSYPLENQQVSNIVEKYVNLGFRRLIIIAPAIEACQFSNIEALKIVTFKPDLSPIANYYSAFTLNYAWVKEMMASGWHNFRYKLAERGQDRLAWILNQTDKKIKTPQALKYEILQRVVPCGIPIRIYWSKNQWLSPKSLFSAKQINVLIKQFMVFDIDGDQIHRPFFPCVYNDQGICEYCFRFAKQHTMRLIDFLRTEGFENLKIVFSGWRGFHVYALDTDFDIKQADGLVRVIIANKIHIDARVTLDAKSVIGVPGTLHGYSMKPLIELNDLANFSWQNILQL